MIRAVAILCALMALPAMADGGPVSPRQFGAKGDGRSDDTKAMKDWLGAVAKSGDGYCPAGVYRTSARLDQPMNSTVHGPRSCVIKPMPGLRGVVWQQGSASILEGITLDGSQSQPGTIGLGFDLRPAGVDAGIFGVTRNVTVHNFRGQNSVGVDAGSTVHWSLQNLDLDTNYDNLHVGLKIGSASHEGTNTLTCDKCEIRSALHWGIYADEGGQEIYLNQPEIITSGAEGIHLDTYNKTPHLTHFIVNGGHIEANNKPGQYQVFVQDVDNFVLRDTKFEPELQTQCDSRPRALRVSGGKDFVLDNVHVCNRGHAIRLEATASGRILNWPAGLNGPAADTIESRTKGAVALP